MSSPGSDTNWKVALGDNAFVTSRNSRLVKEKDPATQCDRQYIVSEDKRIIEIQCLPEDFASFFVGRHIVKDGSLYVMNQVDPLFFFLASQAPDETKKCSWQPPDQTLGQMSDVIRTSISESQIGHLCDVLCTDQTDNVPYFKFSVTKALGWMKKKQDCVYQCLLLQDQAKQKRDKAKVSTCKGGAVSASFNMPDEGNTIADTPSKPDSTVIHSDTKRLKMESMQIVCNYLSEEWCQAFLNFMNVSSDAVFSTTGKGLSTTTGGNKASPTSVASNPVEMDEPSKAKVEAPKTVGNKRLAKVSTKGMKSLNSFFSAPKAKKSKTK